MVVVLELFACGVELEGGTGALADVAENEDLGEGGGDGEGGAGLTVSEACLDEALLVVELGGEGFHFLNVLKHDFAGKNAGGRRVGTTLDEEVTILAVEQSGGAADDGFLLLAVGIGVPVALVDLRGHAVAFAPDQIAGGQAFSAGGEVHREFARARVGDRVGIHEFEGFDAGGQTELEVVVGEVDDVGGPVTEHARAVELEAAPVLLVIGGVIGLFIGGAGPEIPVHAFGDGLTGGVFTRLGLGIHVGLAGTAAAALVAFDPDNVADDAGLDEALELVGSGGGVALVAHLGDDAVFLGGHPEHFGFAEGVGEGLLDVDVFAEAHRGHGGRKVGVVRGGDADGVDVVAHALEHDAEVGKAGEAGPEVQVSRGAFGFEVDVTEGNRNGVAATAEGRDDDGAAAPDADDAEIDALAGRDIAFLVGLAECKVGGEDRKSKGGRGGFPEEGAARWVGGVGCVHLLLDWGLPG